MDTGALERQIHLTSVDGRSMKKRIAAIFLLVLTAGSVSSEEGGSCQKGEAAQQAGNLEQALELYTSCLKTAGGLSALESAVIYHKRCQVKADLSQLEDALFDCHRALKAQPDNAVFGVTLATVYERLGDRHRAMLEYQNALVFDPDLQEAKEGVRRLQTPR